MILQVQPHAAWCSFNSGCSKVNILVFSSIHLHTEWIFGGDTLKYFTYDLSEIVGICPCYFITILLTLS
jgi:hypothetical protein